MSFFKYIRYIPLLIELISFIREADGAFDRDAGAEKKQTVLNRFTKLVRAAASSGLVSQKRADYIIERAEQVVQGVFVLTAASGVIARPELADEGEDVGI